MISKGGFGMERLNGMGTGGMSPMRTPTLEERFERIESQVSSLIWSLATRSDRPARAEEPQQSAPVSFDKGRARLAREKIRERRWREQFLAADLFADPAWDMLLDLYAAFYERRQVSVSSPCIAAAVPATTALRWIKTMTDAGLFERAIDPDDARRIFIGISEKGRIAMDGYFDRLAEGDARFNC
jgi:hypothetical protein